MEVRRVITSEEGDSYCLGRSQGNFLREWKIFYFLTWVRDTHLCAYDAYLTFLFYYIYIINQYLKRERVKENRN